LDFKYYNYCSYYKTLPSVALPEFPKFPQKLKYIQMTNCGLDIHSYKVDCDCIYLNVTDNIFRFTVYLSSKTEYAKSDYFIFDRYPGRKF
jgi:hypothetical protein